MDNNKKRAAAVSAVLQYIKSEQEAVAAMQAAGGQASRIKRAGISGQWGLSGRQSLMQMRNLMQIKSFHGTGLR